MVKKKQGKRHHPSIPAKWLRLFALIPGYDPVATRGPGEWFDPCEAERRIRFIEGACTHIEGELGKPGAKGTLCGKPFLLERWEKAFVGCLFGWKRQDGSRRYREALLYVACKNGKTPLCAAIELCCLMMDGEYGAQDICAARDREQATFLFRHCAGMVQARAELSSRLKVFPGLGQRAIYYPAFRSGFKVIAADAEGAHGFMGSVAIVDELHVQPNPELVYTLRSRMASENRKQTLLLMLTTADFDRPSICNIMHDYASKVRDGIIPDSAFLPVIYEAGREDDWTDERVWEKANPNLDVSVSRSFLRRECKRAQEEIGYQNTFRRMYLNQKTSQDQRVIDMGQWDRCLKRIDLAAMAGRQCWGGLDIGATSDFTALALIFPEGQGEKTAMQIGEEKTIEFIRRSYTWVPIFWLPEEPVKRDSRMAAVIEGWRKQGHVLTTPSNTVDYDQVLADIVRLTSPLALQDIGVDRAFQGGQMCTNLQKHFGESKVFAFAQGILSMAAPWREMLELILAGRMTIDSNPVLRWMASNVVEEDKGGGLKKPSKKRSTEKIDGITAGVMALGRAMVGAVVQQKSIYETRGIVVD
jgi:phage terminase large subunit-like protein